MTWTITGSDGEPILGNTHEPSGPARGVVLVGHGFKGYKDYGMFPRLARRITESGWIAHRFNFSHSGMTERVETFERPDLFERDTWSRQVEDEIALVRAVTAGEIAGAGLPLVLFGHSRGGVAVLLAAGRHAGEEVLAPLAGVVTAAAPATCDPMPADDRRRLLADGFLVSPSSRTGQELRVGRAFLQEQLDDPESHDLLALCRRISVPVLLAHGVDDATVPVASADRIEAAIGDHARVVWIEGGDHVFNMPNPCPEDAPDSVPFAKLVESIQELLDGIAVRG